MPMVDLSFHQRARSDMRANLIYAICDLNDEPCKIITLERTILHCIFKGCTADGIEIAVGGLQTPTGEEMVTAKIRTSDIISIEFKNDIMLPTVSKMKTGSNSGDPRGR